MARKDEEMHDLARETSHEEEHAPAVSHPVESKYHYGMRISPGEHELHTMGIKDNVTPGETYHFHGHARVVDSREDPETGERSASFHFTHMAKAEKVPEEEGGKSVRGEIDDAVAAHDLKAEGREKSAANEGKDSRGEKY